MFDCSCHQMLEVVAVIGSPQVTHLLEPRACRGWNSQKGSPVKILMRRKEKEGIEGEKVGGVCDGVGEDEKLGWCW